MNILEIVSFVALAEHFAMWISDLELKLSFLQSAFCSRSLIYISYPLIR